MKRASIVLALCALTAAASGKVHAQQGEGGPNRVLQQAVSDFRSKQFAPARRQLYQLADLGSAVAETMLGVMYARGLGAPADQASATCYFYRAASRGYGPAQLALANALARGEGTRESKSDAYMWSRLAETHGDDNTAENARRLTIRLRSEIPRDALEQVEKRVESWRPRATFIR